MEENLTLHQYTNFIKITSTAYEIEIAHVPLEDREAAGLDSKGGI